MTTPEHPQIVIPDGSVIITPAQQYAELQATRKAVENLTSTIDPALNDIRGDLHDLAERQKAQQSQIDANTKWRYMLAGALTLLSALVGYGLLNLSILGG